MDYLSLHHPLRTISQAVDQAIAGNASEVLMKLRQIAAVNDWRSVIRGEILTLIGWCVDADDVMEHCRFDRAAIDFLSLEQNSRPIYPNRWAEDRKNLSKSPEFDRIIAQILNNEEVRKALRDRRLHPDHAAIRKVLTRAKRLEWSRIFNKFRSPFGLLFRLPMRRNRNPVSTPDRTSFGSWVWRWSKRACVASIAIMIPAFVVLDRQLPTAQEILQVLGQPSVEIAVDTNGIARVSGRPIVPVPVEFDKLPTHLIEALLTSEDRKFFYHFGFDPIGMARAVLNEAFVRTGLRQGRSQGASTLTQQLAKNALLSSDKTLLRKLKELFLSIKIEWMLSKQEILELYLTNAYFGKNVFGVELAARRYFGLRAQEIEPAHSMLLASLLPAPARFNPEAHFDAARQRAIRLAQTMQLRYPDRQLVYHQAEQVLRQAGSLADIKTNLRSFQAIEWRYFSDWLLQGLAKRQNLPEGTWRAVLTLDPLAQIYAQLAVDRMINAGRSRGLRQAAVVALRPDGSVAALVGGSRYASSQFSRANQAWRQPGSAFKPVLYAAALERGFSSDSILDDRAMTEGGWPRNYSGDYQGKVSMTEAMRSSLNGAAVNLGMTIGVKEVVSMARKLGLSGAMPEKPSLVLGTGEVTLMELTAAYTTFANGGYSAQPSGLVAFRHADGRVDIPAPNSSGQRILNQDTVDQINRMLRSVVRAGGTGQGANFSVHAVGKTGTTQNNRDAWFIGFTGDMIVGIWAGNDENEPMHDSVTGGSLPAEAWENIMANLKDDLFDGRTSAPPGL